jgi:FAD/FMN-containing dehydrogenase/ferredoxin
MLLWDYLADRDTPARRAHIAAWQAELQARLGDDVRIIASFSERELYSRDLGDLPKWIEKAFFRTTPYLVVQPNDAQQIAAVLKFSTEHHLPIVPRGIASTAFGGPVLTRNGLVLDLSPLKKIGSISIGPNPTITVQAGARFGDVEDYVRPYGYTLAVYPSNRLGTIAGWLSSGGFGMNALKYGHVSRWVEAIEVVTLDGSIRWLNNGEDGFDDFVGTEGQMGVITQITLRLLLRPAIQVPHLLSFESKQAAFDFAANLYARGVVPAAITYKSVELLKLLNRLHAIDYEQSSSVHDDEGYLPELPSLLVYCDDAQTEEALQAILNDRSDIHEADRERAGHLWSDRYFPMKIRRLGPSMLAGQVVLPLRHTAQFLDEADRLASQWGLELVTEAHILPPSPALPPSKTNSTGEGSSASPVENGEGPERGLRTLTMPMFLTDQHRASYAAHFVFVPLLDRLGGKYHGQPYNLGIWHAPFADEKYSQARLNELRTTKRRLDPNNLLNPGKFPNVRSRFFGLTGLLLQPWLFKFGMDLFKAVTPIIGLFARRKTSADRPTDHTRYYAAHDVQHDPRFHVSPLPLTFTTPPKEELLRIATECTSCGSCISVCPAYLETHDERTTARGKLWLARRVAEGKPFDQDESDMAFMCLRCRACAEVCQAQLPLMDAWEQLESMLAAQYGRPAGKIKEFLSDVERNPEYQRFVGLKRPGDILTQKWLQGKEIIPLAASRQPEHTVVEEEYDNPIKIRHFMGGKFHIETQAAPSIAPPIGRFNIERSDFCINCGQCAEACVYGVHQRGEFDIRRMNEPDDYLCRACFRCIQECPRQALSISIDATYASFGHEPYTAEVVSSLARQADEGRIPVTGAGYRGKFAGEGFDGMWTDMSEIVRPTRDGIHGREYISTAIDIGRRPSRLRLDDQGQLVVETPPALEIPTPILFQLPPMHGDLTNVAISIQRAAVELSTVVLGQTTAADGLVQLEDSGRVLEELARLKAAHPQTIVVVRVPLKKDSGGRVEQLTRSGVEVIHLAAEWNGRCADGTPLYEALPAVHQQLVAINLRDEVTLLASGGIALAEHLPKTIILGADGVVIDLPLLAALECPLLDTCFAGQDCPTPLRSIDVKWGTQRIVNLMAAWRNQLLEILGAMGLREVRRLRGERGRAMFAKELEEKLFEPLFVDGNE